MFKRATDNAAGEWESRKKRGVNILRYGIDFLDDALIGIMPGDLILLGGPSGLGKTQLCCNIASANLLLGKRVHYIALEAEEFEIEGRLKFPMISRRYHADVRKVRSPRLAYDRWMVNGYRDELAKYEAAAAVEFEKAYKNLFLYYKQDMFTVTDLIKQVSANADLTDLIIVDHVHYFDFDHDNENRALKELAIVARTLALEQGKPIILVAHLRKRDRANNDLVAGLEEFHGSSDLFKVATKVITIAPGLCTDTGGFETFFRVPKNRLNGGVTRYIARCIFSPPKGGYEGGYKISWADQSRKEGFAELDHGLYPDWAKRPGLLGNGNRDVLEPAWPLAPAPRR